MAVWHNRSDRTKTGSRNTRSRKNKKYMLGGDFAETVKGEKDVEAKRTRGGNQKNVVNSAQTVNTAIDGEVKNLEIESVVENEANSEYVRRSLLTKGTVVKTPEGKVRITSRPGQSGNVNGVKID